MSEKVEVVAWQFEQDGWHIGSGMNNHKQNTIDGGFPVRDLMTVAQHRLIVDELVCERDAALDELEQLKRDAERMRVRASALETIAREMRGWLSCEDVNHKKGEFHDFGECPVLVRLDAVLNQQPTEGE